MKGFNLEIYVDKIAEDKQDSFWYKDDIAYAGFPNGKKLYAEARGVIEIMLEVDGDTFKGDEAVAEANRRKLNDTDLDDISAFDGFGNSNWFSFTLVDPDGETLNNDYPIVSTYDEAIEMLKELAEEELKLQYT